MSVLQNYIRETRKCCIPVSEESIPFLVTLDKVPSFHTLKCQKEYTLYGHRHKIVTLR